MRSGFHDKAAPWLAVGWIASLSCLRGAPEASTSLLVAGSADAAAAPSGQLAPADAPFQVAKDVPVGPARIFPDVAGGSSSVIAVQADGSRQLIVAGIRVLDHPDGSMERAREVLPGGPARVVTVPSRLGGGLLVYVVAGGSTQLWRAKGWLDRLEPLGEIWGTVGDIVPGFDRLYARLTSGDIKAIDALSGRQMSLGPLPRATRIGQLAFADAWRAVAVVDFRGALATFDAGMTWRPVPVSESGVAQLSLRNGDFVLEGARQRILLGPRGELEKEEVRDPPPRGREGSVPSSESGAAGPPPDAVTRRWAAGDATGFARRPLRAAIEDGWPDGVPHEGGVPTAIVAHGGALYRVELRAGAVVASRSGAFREEDGLCHGVAMGQGFGFVCGAPGGGTAVYAFAPPLELRPVAQFARPRMIIPSGNGGFVVRGSCARDAPSSSASNDVFCFFSPAGEEREVRAPPGIKREGAALFPVILGDGRPLFVAPPEGDTAGKLFIAQKKGFVTVSLTFDAHATAFKRGTLLDGVEERSPGVLGAWVLSGTELRGLRIGLDGKIDVGHVTTNIERTAVSGRYALEWGRGGRGVETVDGGMTFRPVELPTSDLPTPSRTVAACGAVGCAQGGWLRVGWGGGPDVTDLLAAAAPKPSRVTLAAPRGIALKCYPTGEISGPLPKSGERVAPATVQARPAAKPSAAPPPAASSAKPAWPPPALSLPPRLPPIFVPSPSRPVAVSTPTAPANASPWSAFRGDPPPPLGAGDVGLEAGTDPPMTIQARIYAWGARGSEWSLKGHVLARFDDRFERAGIRTTAIAPSPWAGEDRAGDALGLTAGQSVNWTALLDGSGQAALIVGQRGASKADLYAAAQGQPLVPLRDPDHAPLPLPNSVVRIGSTWFFLVSTMTPTTWGASIYRADGGVVRRLARLPRIPVPAGEFAPKLMRRSQSQGLGILVQGAPGFDQVIRDWYVLPLDPETGELDEPVRLFGSDLEGQIPERCAADRDGWLVNTDLSLAPAIQIVSPAQANVSAVELRLRLEPGSVCVDAMAARTESTVFSQPGLASRVPPAVDGSLPAIPLAATDSSSGRRMLLKCGK
jgi:hypothetical protein